jgi:5-methylcytosine-specific restriction endonuclease McrA
MQQNHSNSDASGQSNLVDESKPFRFLRGIPAEVIQIAFENHLSRGCALLFFAVHTFGNRGLFATPAWISKNFNIHPKSFPQMIRKLREKGLVNVRVIGKRRQITSRLGKQSEPPKMGSVEWLRVIPYSEYLETDHWKKQRASALRRADYRCQLCNKSGELHVHHRTYERRGCESPNDLIVLCRPCHEKFHDILPNEPDSDPRHDITGGTSD